MTLTNTSQTPNDANAKDTLKGRVVIVLVLVIIVQTIYPITNTDAVLPLLVYQTLYSMLIFAGVLVTEKSPNIMRLIIVLGIIWIIAGAIFAFYPTIIWAQIAAYAAVFLLQVAVVGVLMEYIFIKETVTRDVLGAAIAVYILLGAVFVPVYGITEALTVLQTGNSAFVDGAGADPTAFIPWQTFIYYSYATLTTLGYGDILPVTMWARSLASIQAVTGVLYTTIVMARLVSLYVTVKEKGEQS